MNKKSIIIISSIFLLLLFLSISLIIINKNNSKDSLKFKKEYESLNNIIDDKTKEKYINVDIPKDNPFIYTDTFEIIRKVNNKDTFAIFFSYNTCQNARKIIPNIINISKELSINEIYYLNIKDIRNTLIINKNGYLETSKMGTEGYYQLLKIFDEILPEYKIDNKKLKPGKRIYAPSIISVVEGEPISITNLEKDNILINEEDLNNNIKEVLSDIKPSSTCSIQTAC